jgi:hypothetical protein
MRLLKIAGADLRRRDLGGDGQHRHARAVAVEQTVDEMEIARPAAAGAHRELTREMGFATIARFLFLRPTQDLGHAPRHRINV